MICQKCGTREADFHYTENINGNKREVHLCTECAKGSGYGSLFPGLSGFGFSGFALPGALSGILSEAAQGGKIKFERKICDFCGASLENIASSGKLGCAHCYEVFDEELTPWFQRIHAGAKYEGGTPGEAATDLILEKRIAELEKSLAAAVSSEQYEDAARLRDEIKSLRGGGSQGDGEEKMV